MTDDLVYLDHNATTPVAEQVLAAMLPYLTEAFGNPSSPHAPGRRAAEADDPARPGRVNERSRVVPAPATRPGTSSLL